jgi:hypothetical protein
MAHLSQSTDATPTTRVPARRGKARSTVRDFTDGQRCA